MKYKDKKVLVCGMGKSGISAARLLLRHGAVVTLTDSKDVPNVDTDLLENSHISTYFGKNPVDIVLHFDILVLSPGISVNAPFVAKARAAGVTVIGEIELASIVCAAPIIAITGTNGKTTTTSMVGDIMRDFTGGTSHVVGNIGMPFCDVAESIDANTFVTAEISSFQLETIEAFRPKISAVLNMTEDHLDRHITMEQYIAAKERIFENQTAEDFCVLNYDNEITRAMAKKTAAKVVFFSKEPLEEGVFVKGNAIHINWGGYSDVIVKIADISAHVENAMAAAAMAAAAGVSIGIIVTALRNFHAVPHRLEFVREVCGVHFYNDSKATNVGSTIHGIDAMKQPIILIGGGLGKGQDFTDLIKHFGEKVKYFIVMGEATEQLVKTCKDNNFTDFEVANNLQDAMQIAVSKASAGDCVLLSPACASMDMFDNYEHRGNVFKGIVMKF